MLICEACGKEYDLDKNIHVCSCGEPLRMEYFDGEIGEEDDIWARYGSFLPLEVDDLSNLGEGNTPLSKAPSLSKKLDIDLRLKNETMNPTWSFKDRGTILSLERAKELGKKKLGTVSTGNMAASVSAYGVRSGLKIFVLVPSDISDKKISQIENYGPIVIKVDGDYGDLYYESFELADRDTYFTNSNSPFRIEGYKTIAFEIYEENVPHYVIIPTSSGGLFRGVMKGFKELEKSGHIDEIPVPISVQAEGCSPIYEAHESDEREIERWSEPDTIADAISNPFPPGGNDVLEKLDRYDGMCEKVSNQEMVEAQKQIAREGIFCQLASAVGVAALKKLIERGKIEKGAEVVSIITGSGLKGSLSGQNDRSTYNCAIESLEACVNRAFE